MAGNSGTPYMWWMEQWYCWADDMCGAKMRDLEGILYHFEALAFHTPLTKFDQLRALPSLNVLHHHLRLDSASRFRSSLLVASSGFLRRWTLSSSLFAPPYRKTPSRTPYLS